MKLKNFLLEKFHIKILGLLNYFLGIEFNKIEGGMVVHQRKFIKELLQTYDVQDTKFAHLPSQIKLLPIMDNPLQDPTIYKQLIGKLNFLVHTRPYLSFSIQYLSQFNKSPSQAHHKATTHVLHYLKGTINRSLYFNDQQNFKLEAFCDSDWAAFPITRRLVSGYYITFGGTPIS